MKRPRAISFLAAAALLIAPAMARAETWFYPDKEHAVFTLSIPGAWKVEQTADEMLVARSPDEAIQFATWIVRDRGNVAELRSQVPAIARQTLSEVQLTGRETVREVNGIRFHVFKGTGVDRDNPGNRHQFELCLFSPARGAAAVFFAVYHEDAGEEAFDAMVEIVKSIQRAESSADDR